MVKPFVAYESILVNAVYRLNRAGLIPPDVGEYYGDKWVLLPKHNVVICFGEIPTVVSKLDLFLMSS